jgi:hypothetical protein
MKQTIPAQKQHQIVRSWYQQKDLITAHTDLNVLETEDDERGVK